ncbi:hypothetical protein [Demequina sp. NBRC 110054]|uniref:hypothetical protein n=1 Tax=Demequina sp. NBRC 110054 TaxID=1570343 RepID=UPI000A042F3F|nr:hypothetical protein [Demequina sp. NBRC 110054]
MPTLLLMLMLVSLIAVGVVPPEWRELPLTAVALTSGLLMLVDTTSDMPLGARTGAWLAVSAVYATWQWRARLRLVEPLERG